MCIYKYRLDFYVVDKAVEEAPDFLKFYSPIQMIVQYLMLSSERERTLKLFLKITIRYVKQLRRASFQGEQIWNEP